MEAFEQFVAVALREEGFVVSEAVKFPVTRRVKKVRKEEQTHGYEVDLLGARKDMLVLATVKSFFGSRGVRATDVMGTGENSGGYRLLNDEVIRNGVLMKAAECYGYPADQVFMRLYVGKFAGRQGSDERAVQTWCDSQIVGGGPIKLIGAKQVVAESLAAATRGTYTNDPVVVAMKVLAATGYLELPESRPSVR